MTATRVLYWDIDGTLLTTSRAGVPALEDGAAQVLGFRPDLFGMHTAGLTDRMIARQILADAGRSADDKTEAELLRAYAAALPARLEHKRGSVMPGVLETLDSVAATRAVRNVLVTGNIKAGAWAKLLSYQLDHHFDIGGFAEDGFDRADIARAAVARAEERYGEAARDGILIGDTLYDVHAGHEVGLRVLAVNADPTAAVALRAAKPWWFAQRVPSAAEILRRMASTGASSTTGSR